MRPVVLVIVVMLRLCHCHWLSADEDRVEDVHQQAVAAMKRAAVYYRERVASHGGYVYVYTLDLKQRWGEGPATQDQIWIQPPGTPTVGLAFLEAYRATGDEYYLRAATDAALAVAYGQLESGGWTNSVDFDPASPRTAAYRNGKGRGKNNSSLDDGQTQAAIRLMIHADEAHGFGHAAIHRSAEIALAALLDAQFPNGGFPQIWTGPVAARPVLEASLPDYDWRTEGRIKDYWNQYTLNDNVCGFVADALIDAYRIYQDQRYLRALRKLGDFLILAQLPEPQPGWAQQYNEQMQPIWARRFEPAAVAGDESQEVIETLMKIFEVTGDRRYLTPIPPALAYLKRSLLPDGRLARYYELRTNRPLYMTRRRDVYTLTYDDSNLPRHYGWKWESRLSELAGRYDQLTRDATAPQPPPVTAAAAREIIAALDEDGRWVSVHGGERIVGQAKLAPGAEYLSSERFSRNLTALSRFVLTTAEAAAADLDCTARSNISTGKMVVCVRKGTGNPVPSQLLIHFHGAPDVVQRAFVRSGLEAALVVVNFPGLSSAYSQPFEQDADLFQEILRRATVVAGTGDSPACWKRIIVSSFSAGYGAVRQILKTPSYFEQIDAVVAADSIYAGLQAERPAREVKVQQMRDFVRFAQLAAAGQKAFVVSHSTQPTPYASTTETADYLLRSLNLSREPDRSIRTETMQQLSRATRGRFVVLGFAGQSGRNHLQHLHNIDLLWRRLPSASQ